MKGVSVLHLVASLGPKELEESVVPRWTLVPDCKIAHWNRLGRLDENLELAPCVDWKTAGIPKLNAHLRAEMLEVAVLEPLLELDQASLVERFAFPIDDFLFEK